METKKYVRVINNLNFLASPFVTDATREIEVSEAEYLKTTSCKLTEVWQWNEELEIFEAITSPYTDALRFAREWECFQLMNRSPLWFMSLSTEKQEELKKWYQAWLDVTETGVVPTKPDWLE